MRLEIARREEVISLAMQGHPPREIEEMTGLSRETVYYDLKVARRSGQEIPYFKSGTIEQRPSERQAKVTALALSGTPPWKIAETLGIDTDAVHYELRVARRKGAQIPAFRGGRRPRDFRILRVAPAVLQPLVTHATSRGIPTVKLAERLLERIAADDLVDAVLDDGGADG